MIGEAKTTDDASELENVVDVAVSSLNV